GAAGAVTPAVVPSRMPVSASGLQHPTGADDGHYLIFADRQGVAAQLETCMHARGLGCSLVYVGEQWQRMAEQSFTIHPSYASDFDRLLTAVTHNLRTPLRGVVHLWSLDEKESDALDVADVEAAVQRGCGSTLHLVRSLLRAGFSHPP